MEEAHPQRRAAQDLKDETKDKEKPGPKATPRGTDKGEAKAPAAQSATLRVKIVAEAALLVDGEPTQQAGPERLFVTPPLEPGVSYHYVLSATWAPDSATKVTRTRKAYVEAGKTTEVDLRREDPAQPDKVVRSAEGKG